MSEQREIRDLAQRLFFLADKTLTSAPDEELQPAAQRVSHAERVPFLDVALGQFAYCLWKARSKRTPMLDSRYFGEAAWDMLLDLFVQRVKGKEVSIVSACIASNVPTTTALRWLDLLIDEGLVDRRNSDIDKRVAYVSLSDRGLSIMRKVLREQMDEMRPLAAMLMASGDA